MDDFSAKGNSGFICGEESFGTGSAHIREKDGIWAVLGTFAFHVIRRAHAINQFLMSLWLQPGCPF